MVPCHVNRCFIIQYITRQNHIYPTQTKNLDLLGVQILQKLHPAVFVGMCMQYACPAVNLYLVRPVYPSNHEITDIYASLNSSEVSRIAAFCTDLRKTFLENPQNRPNSMNDVNKPSNIIPRKWAEFYAPGLKGPLGAPSVRLFVRNSVDLLTYIQIVHLSMFTLHWHLMSLGWGESKFGWSLLRCYETRTRSVLCLHKFI